MRQEYKFPQPNFVRKILEMQDAGTLPKAIGVHIFDVSHDGWCPYFRGRPCDGDSDIMVQWSQPAVAWN
jgi:hypothetical protein